MALNWVILTLWAALIEVTRDDPKRGPDCAKEHGVQGLVKDPWVEIGLLNREPGSERISFGI